MSIRRPPEEVELEPAGVIAEPLSALGERGERTGERNGGGERNERGLDVARDSDVPISTQIYWQLAYQIDSGRLLPGSRLPTVRELGAALRVNPNTIRAVYRRLADAGYVTSRVGAGTTIAERPLHRGPDALAGVVAELLRRAAQMGFTADEVAAATFAAATERRRPSERLRVLVAECTIADARHAATTVAEAFPALVEAEGALIEEVPFRLERFHYDLVATTAFHGLEVRELAGTSAPVVTMLTAPGYLDQLREIALLPQGATVSLVCISPRVAEGMERSLRISGVTGVRILPTLYRDDFPFTEVESQSSLILLSREAVEAGAVDGFQHPERVREWMYELDPSGIELLRRAIDHIRAVRDGSISPSAADDPFVLGHLFEEA